MASINALVVSSKRNGSIDFPAFFRVLKKNDSSGWMVFEQDVKFGATPIAPAQNIVVSSLFTGGCGRACGHDEKMTEEKRQEIVRGNKECDVHGNQ